MASQVGSCLHKDDLIDDHELASVDDDRLAHAGIADQLAALVRTVKTPSNIALYGPWGSGKSGIANLLKDEVDRKDGVRYARFDAFKYAELPFRRNFVSAVATELGRQEDKYHTDLYSGRTKTDIHVPAATIVKILGIFAVLIVGLTLILTAVVAVVAAVQSGDFKDSFKSLAEAAVLAGLVPAALLSALVALASKTFQVDRSVAKPESDEQFEQLFKDLVADSKAKRLVIFVDELDRCSASEVVATLDTVRTFLGVEKCVFVIAADQQVLEEALTRAARQETPSNDTNPYYSTGSAYLDKVFQYQISLPPLLSQSINNFATTLVRDRGGLWADINAEYVVSILIPTHVTSPRRVKHLLNTFALTYRLAEERHRSHLLAEDPKVHAASIARLACLRVEFPLFARHLELDAHLPDLVLQLVRDPEASPAPGVSDRAWELARAYALENAAPDRLLALEGADEDEADDAAEKGAARQTAEVHNKQLLNYLSRTRGVAGPSRDLIYQQSSGTVLGLDGELAIAIENAAEDGDIDALHRLVNGLDEAGQQAALALLSQHIRTGLGVAGPNSARSLLLLLERLPSLPTARIVDTVCESISVMHDDDTELLDEDTIESAWLLSKSGTDIGAASLRALVISVAAAEEDWDSPPDFLLDDAVLALDSAPDSTIQYVSNVVVGDEGESARTRLFALPDDSLIRVLLAVSDSLVTRMEGLIGARDAWDEEQKTAAAAPVVTTRGTATAPDRSPEPLDPSSILDSFVEHAKTRETPVQHETLRFLLRIDSIRARNAAIALLRVTEPVGEPSLASSIIGAARRRAIHDLPAWLNGVAATSVTAERAPAFAALCQKIWDDGDADNKRIEAALAALAPLHAALPADSRPDITDHVLKTVNFWAHDNEEATDLLSALKKVRIFEEAGLVDSTETAAAIVNALEDILANSVPVTGRGEPLYDYVTTEGLMALKEAAPDHAKIEKILAEAATCAWLDEIEQVNLSLAIIAATGTGPDQTEHFPSPDAMAALSAAHGGAAATIATQWVALGLPGPDDLAAIFEPLKGSGAVTLAFADAATTARSGWSNEQREAFVRRYLTRLDAPVPNSAELKVIGLADLDDQTAAQFLVQRFAAATNNVQRQSVISLWKQASIKDDAARKTLIEKVVYGLLDLHVGASSNSGAVDMALNALNDLGAPLPWGVKGELGDRVRQAVGESEALNERATRVMPRLGYRTVKGGWLRRTRRVDFDAD